MDKKTKKSGVKKVLGLVGAGLLLVGAGIGGTAIVDNSKFNAQDAKITELTNQVTALENTPAETVTETVEVDNGKLASVLQAIYDSDGNMTSLDLTSDLDDDEVALIADRIVMVNEFESLADNAVKADLADALEDFDKNISGDGEYKVSDFDKNDITKIKVGDDATDVVASNIDFEDKDADVVVKGTFFDEESDKKYKYEATVEIRDNEVDEVTVTKVTVSH